jgi:long-subunit acyl-CoA synthetase (AMP-forming)
VRPLDLVEVTAEEALGCIVLEGYGLSENLADRLVQPPHV